MNCVAPDLRHPMTSLCTNAWGVHNSFLPTLIDNARRGTPFLIIPSATSYGQQFVQLGWDSPTFARDSKQTVLLITQTILLEFDVWFHQVLIQLEEYPKRIYQFHICNFLLTCILNFSLCLLYTSPSPRDKRQSRMPSSA